MIDIDNPYRYLEVRGRVSDISDDDDNGFTDSMAQKYLGKRTYPNHQPGDHRVVVTVDVEHTTQMG